MLGISRKIIGSDAIRADKNCVSGAIENYMAVRTKHEENDFW